LACPSIYRKRIFVIRIGIREEPEGKALTNSYIKSKRRKLLFAFLQEKQNLTAQLQKNKKTPMLIYNAADKNLAITDVLTELKRKAYKLKFRRDAVCLYCFELQELIMPEDFTVDESYYFEEIETPDADRMLYAISLSQGVKGFLIDTCNVYMDNISPEMMEKLNSNKATRHNYDLINAAA